MEGNVLFNNALNIFYLRLYGVGDIQGGNNSELHLFDIHERRIQFQRLNHLILFVVFT